MNDNSGRVFVEIAATRGPHDVDYLQYGHLCPDYPSAVAWAAEQGWRAGVVDWVEYRRSGSGGPVLETQGRVPQREVEP